jgi:ADP-dependent NAD(P)H-hydrate dehydratase / NAD(P)H-hydrate epimerase
VRLPASAPRLVTAEEMAGLDRAAITTRGIPSLTLMERAGREAARAIVAWWRAAGGVRRRGSGAAATAGSGAGARGARITRPGAALGSVLVFCGRGNNGGDGLVVARHLKAAGFTPRALVAAAEESLSPDARTNLDACLKARVPVTFLPDRRAWGVGSEAAIAAEGSVFLVDALLGTGSKGPPRDGIAAAIELATLAQKPIASIDIPSGVDATTGHASLPSIRADLTLTLGLAKVGLALEPGRDHAGEIQVLDIGIPHDLVDALRPSVVLATAAWARALLPRRAPNAHKGSAGRVLVIGGSAGMMGAVALASHSSLRAGAGYSVAAVPGSCVDVLESRVTEVVKRGFAETSARSLAHEAVEAILPDAQRADAVAIGPGLSRDPDTERLVWSLLDQVEAPIVLDADGLNAFEGKSLQRGHGPLIVTPHYGEAARLGGVSIGEVARDPLGWARSFAASSGAIVCLKSVPMLTVAPHEPAILNSTGNPGMATAGAGDVLTGTIAGLLAQGMDAAEAAAVGCFVSGLAGDIAARRLGRRGLTAGDIRDALPAALVALESGALDGQDAGDRIDAGVEDWL